MASALINEIPAISIKEFELGEVTIDIQTKAITSSSIGLSSLRNIFGLSILGSSIAQPLIRTREIISSETLLNIIKTSEKISKNKELQNISLILLEAYTHLRSMEYSAAFLLSWYIIEYDIMIKLNKILKDKGITGERKKKIGEYRADTAIEVLSLLSKISDEDYYELMKLKKIRNKIVHERETPSKKDVQKCFDSAFNIFKYLMDILG